MQVDVRGKGLPTNFFCSKVDLRVKQQEKLPTILVTPTLDMGKLKSTSNKWRVLSFYSNMEQVSRTRLLTYMKVKMTTVIEPRYRCALGSQQEKLYSNIVNIQNGLFTARSFRGCFALCMVEEKAKADNASPASKYDLTIGETLVCTLQTIVSTLNGDAPL